MSIERSDPLEKLAEDGSVTCPLCGGGRDRVTLQGALEEQRIATEDFARLCDATDDGMVGLVLRVGLHATSAIEDMGEPTVEFQENFDRLEKYLERVESTADTLETEAEG